MKTKFVVRIVQTHTPTGKEINEGGQISEEFIESLRYAGLIVNHPINDEKSLTSKCFDLLPPSDISDSRTWAMGNAIRMRTFGFNAVCAPAMN